VLGTRRSATRGLRTLLVAVFAGALFAPGITALASAGDFTPAPGTYTIDTTALTLTGPSTNITGTNDNGVALFTFGTVNIPSGVVINASGSRPLKIVASGSLTLAGTINGVGTSAADNSVTPVPGGPGGGAGGVPGPCCSGPWAPGGGPGGGGAPAVDTDGGGGGGFGGKGARGGVLSGTNYPAGGATYGDLNSPTLQAGSGGGSDGCDAVGGGGGGAVALFGGSLLVAGSGVVNADGGNGAASFTCSASGGGSGGGIVVHGDTVEVDGVLVARGGSSYKGCSWGDGGAGGGGRIAYQFRTLIASGLALVNGGTSDLSGICTSGAASPDPVGAGGVVTKTFAETATTTPATDVTFNAATLNGSVNPQSNATSFHFEYGTTTAYGAATPEAGVGSDAADHPLSAAVGGLAPLTTYHYRVVATDAMGFVTAGADVGFTTPPVPTPPPPPPPPPPTPRITSAINNVWLVNGASITALKLTATNVPAGSTIKLTCKGRPRCRFKLKTKHVTKTGRVDLVKVLGRKNTRFKAGQTLEIRITHPGYIGKDVRFKFKKGKIPKGTVLCIKLGASKPSSC
jgi:hypothetical protein